jgi:hypothetical protein
MSISKRTVWILLDSLKVLSDPEEQRRLWCTYDPNVIAYFKEEHMMLVHDSGLLDALRTGGTGFGKDADEVLRRLVDAVRLVDAPTEEEIIHSPEMGVVRDLAARALVLIGDRADLLPE